LFRHRPFLLDLQLSPLSSINPPTIWYLFYYLEPGRVRYSPQLTSMHTCPPLSCQATPSVPPSQLLPRSPSISIAVSDLHRPTMSIRTCLARRVTQLTPEHYRKHRKQLVEKGAVKKNHADSTQESIYGVMGSGQGGTRICICLGS